MARARLRNEIFLGCTITGLAATMYDNFNTANSFIKLPVVEDQDIDKERQIQCEYKRDSNRYKLLKAAYQIMWDE